MNYLSTNLNCKPYIYLNDVEVEDVSHQTLSQRKQHILWRQECWKTKFSCIDPRFVLKEAKSKGIVNTLVDYDEVATLSEYAVNLQLQHVTEANHQQP